VTEADTTPRYCLVVDGDEGYPIETYARDPFGSGAIHAHNRAVIMSRGGGVPVALYVGETYLARYARGRWIEGAELASWVAVDG
jgi:hypothetical protein